MIGDVLDVLRDRYARRRTDVGRVAARRSSWTQRTDNYRQEVRSAVSAITHATLPFLDAASVFENSIFWVNDAVRATPGHDESYRACRAALDELKVKINDFEFCMGVDIRLLSKYAFMLSVYTINDTINDIYFGSEQNNLTKAWFDDKLKQIKEHRQIAREKLFESQGYVQKYMPHTIVGAKRRRERTLRPVSASWCWLMRQHRKNFASSPAKQKPPRSAR